MAITVRELVDTPYLATRVRAGAGGLDREVRFAHACEMPAPWEWLNEGDVLLTSGMGLPRGPGEQAEYVRRLADAGLSGMSIGEAEDLPPISPRMVEMADRKRLPLLLTAYEVPWVAVIRTVIDANSGDEQRRLAMMARIYDRVRESVASGNPAGMLDSLGHDLECRLAVYGNGNGRQLLEPAADVPAELADAFVQAVSDHGGRMPAVVHLRAGELRAVVVPIPSTRPASLIALPRGRARTPDLALLQHVATVTALELERSTANRAQRLRLGAELLAEMIDVPMDPAAARRRLAEHGLKASELVLAAWGGADFDADELHEALAAARRDHLLLRREDSTVTLLADPGEAVDELARLLPAGARIGVSDPFTRPAQAADALRQAVWALQAAIAAGTSVACYGEHHAPFLPSTLAEAQVAVERVLGPLLEHDEAHRSDLVRTLRVFLECNRSWKQAAELLFVHKQTLVYRIGRIEELTGRKLTDTHDVAELWLALRTLELAGLRTNV